MGLPGRSTLWAAAVVGFGLFSWPIARQDASAFSVETYLWVFLVWLVLIRALSFSVGRADGARTRSQA